MKRFTALVLGLSLLFSVAPVYASTPDVSADDPAVPESRVMAFTAFDGYSLEGRLKIGRAHV